MTQPTHIAERIREFIVERFPLAKRRTIGNDDSLLDGGVIDSLSVLEIVTFIETDLGVTLADDEMTSENFESISALADLVHARLSKEGAAWTS